MLENFVVTRGILKVYCLNRNWLWIRFFFVQIFSLSYSSPGLNLDHSREHLSENWIIHVLDWTGSSSLIWFAINYHMKFVLSDAKTTIFQTCRKYDSLHFGTKRWLIWLEIIAMHKPHEENTWFFFFDCQNQSIKQLRRLGRLLLCRWVTKRFERPVKMCYGQMISPQKLLNIAQAGALGTTYEREWCNGLRAFL